MERILKIKKNIGVLSKNEKNPFFKSSYLDLNALLNAVEPLLWEENLVLLQPIIENSVVSSIHDAETGESLISSSIELPSITDPQKLGSAITYFRRYTLKSLLAISEEDDDGNKASQSKPVLKIDSKEFLGGLNKKTPLEVMEKHFDIPLNTANEYTKKLKDGGE